MAFGKCKVCIEKDARIADLQDQIRYFKGLLHPEPKTRSFELVNELEQDMVLDGGGKDEIDLEAEYVANELARREQDQIFSGNDEIPEVGT